MKLDSAPTSLVASNIKSAAKNFDVAIAIDKPEPIDTQKVTNKQSSAGAIFSSTFITIFLAELGDKTQLSTLLMSAESQAPGIVFLGAATALITTSLLGVILGRWIASKLAPKTVEIAAGVSLLFISGMLLLDVIAA